MLTFHQAVLDRLHRSLDAYVDRSTASEPRELHMLLERELLDKLVKDIRDDTRRTQVLRDAQERLQSYRALISDPCQLMSQILSNVAEGGTPYTIPGMDKECNEAQTILAQARQEREISNAYDLVQSQAWKESKRAWCDATRKTARERLEDFQARADWRNDAERTSLHDLAYRVVASHLGEVFSLGAYLLAPVTNEPQEEQETEHETGRKAKMEGGTEPKRNHCPITWEYFSGQLAWQDYVESEVDRLLARTRHLQDYDDFLSARHNAGPTDVVTLETMFNHKSETRPDRVWWHSVAFRDQFTHAKSANLSYEQQSRNVCNAWLEGQRSYEEGSTGQTGKAQVRGGPISEEQS